MNYGIYFSYELQKQAGIRKAIVEGVAKGRRAAAKGKKVVDDAIAEGRRAAAKGKKVVDDAIAEGRRAAAKGKKVVDDAIVEGQNVVAKGRERTGAAVRNVVTGVADAGQGIVNKGKGAVAGIASIPSDAVKGLAGDIARGAIPWTLFPAIGTGLGLGAGALYGGLSDNGNVPLDMLAGGFLGGAAGFGGVGAWKGLKYGLKMIPNNSSLFNAYTKPGYAPLILHTAGGALGGAGLGALYGGLSRGRTAGEDAFSGAVLGAGVGLGAYEGISRYARGRQGLLT